MTRSNTSICLQLDLPKEKVKALTTLLEKERVAYDIGSYRDAPPGCVCTEGPAARDPPHSSPRTPPVSTTRCSLRIWGGATVEPDDTAALLQWIRWAYHTVA